MRGLTINLEAARNVAVILYGKFNSDEGIFGHNVMPEDLLPKWGSSLSSSNIARGSYEHLMFITLVVSIDYQRNADQLWEAGRRTFEDQRTRWLFMPRELITKSFSEIISAMRVHALAKKPTKDAWIWSTVSKSLFELYDSDPLNLIKGCDYDALKIYNKKFYQRFKRKFPYLTGDKIFPLWIRMLHDNVGINLRNLDKIPIPVDIHIARASFTTGCLTGKYSGSISEVRYIIDEAWKSAVESINHPKLKYRLQLDEPLWHLSRYGCKFRTNNFCPKRAGCPVSQFCVRGIVHVTPETIEIDT
jgi:hypothetical protein